MSPIERLRDLNLDIHYEGFGEELVEEFTLPALGVSTRYDRLSSYFSSRSFVAVAEGIEALWRQNGTMRLIIGEHDVPRDIAAAADPEHWVEEVIEGLRRRLLAEISTLSEELHRHRIATIAWMMQDGLLRVRVAVPRNMGTTVGIVHNKRLLFRDRNGDSVTAVGSPNETAPGLGGNYEELTVHRSWDDHHGYVARHIESFERLWGDRNPAVAVKELSPELATELLDALGNPPRPIELTADLARSILDIARSAKDWAALNSSTAVLYPHQERAFIDGLSRWPIRVMLADEVGLGKTLEAGAIASYLYRSTGTERILVLAPANLTRQWQEELDEHFGLSFWTFDPSRRIFSTLEGDEVWIPPDGSPIADAPPHSIMSIQWARGSRSRGHVFADISDAELPDLLIVDEAHHARIRRDINGHRRPTLIWRMLDDIVHRVPHVVFATATPVQVDPIEYHGLLDLLGLPDEWRSDDAYEASLNLLARGSDMPPRLNEAAIAAELIVASHASYRWPTDASESSSALLEELEAESDDTQRALLVMHRWSDAYPLLVRSHPGSLLTVRNTRAALEELGYRFPERNFESPALGVSPEIRGFYRSVDDYLSTGFGEVEKAIDPDRRSNLGFARSNYHQRLASSLTAARRTLERRLERIDAIAAGLTAPATVYGPLDEDEDDSLTEAVPAQLMTPQLEWAIGVERRSIKDLLEHLDRVNARDPGADPKIAVLLDLLDDYTQRDSVLVFSRYTDTLSGAYQAFKERFGADAPPHAKYTGQEVWIDVGEGPVASSKQGIRERLDDGELKIVFCSDAASEGLNLQAARVLINVDVPWNPARLEQRIGRIARLGQRAETVDVYNLWYPNSVEARMYSRLLQRRDLYELAVGQFPEIVSQQIREALAIRIGVGGAAGPDAIGELQRLREATQFAALQRVWGTDFEQRPESMKLRTELVDLAAIAARDLGFEVRRDQDSIVVVTDDEMATASTEAGTSDALSLHHPVLDLLEGEASMSRFGASVCAVEVDGTITGLCLKYEDGAVVRLPAESLARLLAAARGGEPLDLDLSIIVAPPPGASRWAPDHGQLSMIAERVPDSPPVDETNATLRVLGSIPLALP